MTTLAALRSPADVRSRIEARARWELEQAERGGPADDLISTHAAALFLRVPTKTLMRQRSGEVPGGPECWSKPNARVGGRGNEHVKYSYKCLSQWREKQYRQGTVLGGRDPRQDSSNTMLGFASLFDITLRDELWVEQDGRILGHSQLVPEADLDAAIAADRLLEAPLSAALLEHEWSSAAIRRPFHDAFDLVLAATRSESESIQIARQLDEDLLPARPDCPKCGKPIPPGNRHRCLVL